MSLPTQAFLWLCDSAHKPALKYMCRCLSFVSGLKNSTQRQQQGKQKKQSWDAKGKTELQMRKEFSWKGSEGERSVEEMMGKEWTSNEKRHVWHRECGEQWGVMAGLNTGIKDMTDDKCCSKKYSVYKRYWLTTPPKWTEEKHRTEGEEVDNILLLFLCAIIIVH